MSKKQKMRYCGCKLRRLNISGVWNEKPKKKGRGLLKSSAGKKRPHGEERWKSAEWKRRNVGGTKKKENGKKRRRTEQEKRQKLRLRSRCRDKGKISQGHNFKANISASTKRSSYRSVRCLAWLVEKIQSARQNEIASKNSRDS